MKDKDQIIKDLLRSKAELMANRNERFAIIQEELEDLHHRIDAQFDAFLGRISELN